MIPIGQNAHNNIPTFEITGIETPTWCTASVPAECNFFGEGDRSLNGTSETKGGGLFKNKPLLSIMIYISYLCFTQLQKVLGPQWSLQCIEKQSRCRRGTGACQDAQSKVPIYRQSGRYVSFLFRLFSLFPFHKGKCVERQGISGWFQVVMVLWCVLGCVLDFVIR